MPVVPNSPPQWPADTVLPAIASSSWDESPQDPDGNYKMHVLLPEFKSWILLDIKKQAFTNFGEKANKRVRVSTVEEELSERLSKFKDAPSIEIYKCSAETARGKKLDPDRDTVYYLTWLIAWTSDAGFVPIDMGDGHRVDNRITWETYIPPADTANMLKVMVYIEPCDVWEEIWLPNKAACTNNAKYFTNTDDLRSVVLSFM